MTDTVGLKRSADPEDPVKMSDDEPSKMLKFDQFVAQIAGFIGVAVVVTEFQVLNKGGSSKGFFSGENSVLLIASVAMIISTAVANGYIATTNIDPDSTKEKILEIAMNPMTTAVYCFFGGKYLMNHYGSRSGGGIGLYP